MSNDIATVLAELRQDHRNMAILLSKLEREAENFFHGGRADFQLMHDIMDYMTIYPDAVHHPKEDRIYAELRAVRPDLTSGMSVITREHRTIAEQSLYLRDKIAQVLVGDVVERNPIVASAMRYIEALRNHMHWEEKDLFRRIEKMIADGHPAIEDSVLLNVEDPLFGTEVEKRFERLRDSAMQS